MPSSVRLAPAGIATCSDIRPREWLLRREAEGFNDLAIVCAPQPGAPGDQRVRDLERQGATCKRQTIRHEVRTQFRQQPVGAGDPGGGINQPTQRRRQLHHPMMGLTHQPCHALSINPAAMGGSIND